MASNQEKEEQRQQMAASVIELGVFLCTNLKELSDTHAKNQNVLTAYCETTENPDEEICQAYKEKAEESQQALDFVSKYYADVIVQSKQLYEEKLIERQQVRVKDLLQNRGNKQATRYVDIFWQSLKNYYKTDKVERSTWLQQCAQ